MPQAHLVQLRIAWEAAPANRERVSQLLAAARIEPGDLVLLPEMFATGFSFNVPATHDGSGQTLSFLQSLAQNLHVTVLGGRTLLHPSGKGQNVLTIAPPPSSDWAALDYAKVHLFPTEAPHFEPGSAAPTFPWAGLTASPALCYDLRFPELFRLGLKRGVGLFAVAACWPQVRQHHWRALLVARAIENQAFVLGCNRVGHEPGALGQGLDYAGGSIALGPKGEVLGELGDEEGVLSVPIDPQLVTDWRRTFRAWRDLTLI